MDSFVYDEADTLRLQRAMRERPASVRAAARAQNAAAAFNQERCTGRAPVGDIHVGPGITYGHGFWTGKVIRRSPIKQRLPPAAPRVSPDGRRVLTSPRRGASPGRMTLRGNAASINTMSSFSSMPTMSTMSGDDALGEVQATINIRNSPIPDFWQLSPVPQRRAADPHHGAGLPTRDINPPKQQPSPPLTAGQSSQQPRVSTPENPGPRCATPGATYQVLGQDVVPAALIKLRDGTEIMKGEEKNKKDADGKVVGTEIVINYDAAIDTFKTGVALAVAADSWDLQTQLEEQLTNAKHAKAVIMKERAQAMATADPPKLRDAADLLAEALMFNDTDPELASLRGGFLKELGKAQQADGGDDDPPDLRAAIATFAEAASADPADEEILSLRIAALKAVGQAAREDSEDHPADIPAALAAFVEAMRLDADGTDEELATLKEECEAALAEPDAANDDAANDDAGN